MLRQASSRTGWRAITVRNTGSLDVCLAGVIPTEVPIGLKLSESSRK